MLKPGDVLDGKYRITRQIGEGGMGAVYAGENTRVRKTVAIKVLHKGGGGVADAVARFEREAQAAGTIGSDHIVEVHDLGTTSDGERFMVMEYLDGESLRDRLKRGAAVPPTEIIPIVLQLLEGLAAAHAAEIVHRDLKPDNIFILKEKAGRADFVKILDFGISKFLNMNDADGGSMTRTGMVMGSPNYMSPEQVKSSNDVDGRSDLYTVGVILFEAVTGHVPFKAPTFTELLFKIVYEPLPHPCAVNPSLDPAFAEILRRACASNRADRYQTARDFATALLAYLGYVPSPATNAGVPSVKTTALGVGDTISRPGVPQGKSSGQGAMPSAPGLPRMGLPPMAPPPVSGARGAVPSAPRVPPPSAPRVAPPSAPKVVPLAELTFDEPRHAPGAVDVLPGDRAAPYPVIEENDGDRTVAIPNATPSGPFPSPIHAASGALPAFAPPPKLSLQGAPIVQQMAPPSAPMSSVESPSGSFVFGPPPGSMQHPMAPPAMPASPPVNAFGNQSGGFVAPEVPPGSQSGGFMPNTFGAVHVPPALPAEPRRSSNKMLAFVAALAVLAGAAVGTILYLRSSGSPSGTDARSAGSGAPSTTASSPSVAAEPPPRSSPTPATSIPLVLSAEPSASSAPSAAPSASAAASSTVVAPKIVPIRPKPDEQLGY